MTDHAPDTHQSVLATGPLALKSNLVLGPNAHDVARESVDDALMIVESYGPWGADLNDAHRRQIVLADEVKRLRHLYEMAVRGRAEMRAALRTEREGYDIMGLAEEQRQKPGPFGGPGTPNAVFGA